MAGCFYHRFEYEDYFQNLLNQAVRALFVGRGLAMGCTILVSVAPVAEVLGALGLGSKNPSSGRVLRAIGSRTFCAMTLGACPKKHANTTAMR
jgi:hypothetical protein